MVGCYEFTNPYTGFKREYFDFVAYHNPSNFDTFSAVLAFVTLGFYLLIIFLVCKFIIALGCKILFKKKLDLLKFRLDFVNLIPLLVVIPWGVYYYLSRECGV